MALILRDIYKETKKRYQLELIAGEHGLEQIMNWVYVAEDYTTSDFLRGGELIITTGAISNNSPDWLPLFLEHMLNHQTCGVILNEGKYIQRENISSEVLAFCDEHHLPLFLMPWRIPLYDITRDYYERIFTDTNHNEKISNALLSLINREEHTAGALALLNSYDFKEHSSYYVAAISTSHSKKAVKNNLHITNEPFSSHDQFTNLIQLELINEPYPCHLFKHQQAFLLIVQAPNHEYITKITERILHKLQKHVSEHMFYIGISGQAQSLVQLADCYQQAYAAMQLGQHMEHSISLYEDMGFFKLLLAIPNAAVLEQFVHEKLHAIHEYDKIHRSSFSETLYLYLLHAGSIKEVAAESFCHRNTINNRIRIIKECLGYELDNPTVCFELMAAFLIKEYLNSKINHLIHKL